MAKWFRVLTSFEEEAEADREYWLRFTPEERVALIDTMRHEWAEVTNTVKPSNDQVEFLACLQRHGVRALLIGAHALGFHAKPRYTKDLDVLIEPSEENARRVIAAIDEFGFGALGLQAQDLSEPGRIVQLGYEPNRIDILTRIAGVTFEEAWENRVEATYAGQRVFFIGAKDLIRNKEAAARPQDLADADLLRRFL